MSGGCCLRIFVPSTKVTMGLVKLSENTAIHYNHDAITLLYFDRTSNLISKSVDLPWEEVQLLHVNS